MRHSPPARLWRSLLGTALSHLLPASRPQRVSAPRARGRPLLRAVRLRAGSTSASRAGGGGAPRRESAAMTSALENYINRILRSGAWPCARSAAWARPCLPCRFLLSAGWPGRLEVPRRIGSPTAACAAELGCARDERSRGGPAPLKGCYHAV